MGRFDKRPAQSPELANCKGLHSVPYSRDRHLAATLWGSLGLSSLCSPAPDPSPKETSGSRARGGARGASGEPLEISASPLPRRSPVCPRVDACPAKGSLQTLPHIGDAAPLREQVSRAPPDWKAAPGPGSRAGPGARARGGGTGAVGGGRPSGRRGAGGGGGGGLRGRRAADRPRRPRPAPPAPGSSSARAARGAGSGGKSRDKGSAAAAASSASLAGPRPPEVSARGGRAGGQASAGRGLQRCRARPGGRPTPAARPAPGNRPAPGC